MNTAFRFGLVVAGSLALAACGSSDDVSEDTTAESVEVIAEETMEPVTEGPVEDTAVAPQPVEEEQDISPVEIKSNTEQSEEAAALAAEIQAELAKGNEPATGAAEPVEE
ncbi:hypothetical protein LY632_03610 [Erythrobacter sp. SDW2]|uniref:hypothetical protein n=1 Tax=Erythrobacter sp. SDW2 TaxID=2907154 RepID=UPI001F214D65|nr:hypothetical protein [Erythrobacter sp. SDW2]UIP07496.1 hypothetical protein LY632_03610 [Erythrobacter sp. SDW2]